LESKGQSRNNPLGVKNKTTRDISPTHQQKAWKTNLCNAKENNMSAKKLNIEKSY